MRNPCWSGLVALALAAAVASCGDGGGDTDDEPMADGGGGAAAGGAGSGWAGAGGSSAGAGGGGAAGTAGTGAGGAGVGGSAGVGGGAPAADAGAPDGAADAAGSGQGGAGDAGAAADAPAAALVTVEDTTFMGRGTWLIKTGKFTYYFEKGNGRSGFYRMIDSNGKDWVQAGLGRGAVSNGIPGEWRGFPNATASNFGHPLRNSRSTTVVKGGVTSGDKIILDSSSPTMQFEYWIFPSHIAIKVLKAQEPYCFLIETTPGGSQNGWFVDAKGKMHPRPLFSDRNAPGAAVRAYETSPEWLYFGADSSSDVMFFGKTPDDNFTDEIYTRPGDMDIYGFGRLSVSPWPRYIPAGQLQHVAVIGFLPKEGSFEQKKAIIEAIMKNPFEAYRGD